MTLSILRLYRDSSELAQESRRVQVRALSSLFFQAGNPNLATFFCIARQLPLPMRARKHSSKSYVGWLLWGRITHRVVLPLL